MKTEKLIVIFLLCTGAFWLTACDNEDVPAKKQVPAQIQKAFSEKFPSARIENFTSLPDYYKLEFSDSCGNPVTAYFNNEGKWELTRTKLSARALSPVVQETFERSDFASGRIVDIDQTERCNMDGSLYTLCVKTDKEKYDVYIHQDGLHVSTVRHRGMGYNDPFWWVEIPQEIVDYVSQNYPGIPVLGILSTEDGQIEIDLFHEGYLKKLRFSGNGMWRSVSWPMGAEEALPENVAEYVAAKYPGYQISNRRYIDSFCGIYYWLRLNGGKEELLITLRDDISINQKQ